MKYCSALIVNQNASRVIWNEMTFITAFINISKVFFIHYVLNQTISMSMSMDTVDDAPITAEIAGVVGCVFSYLFIFLK